jgi:ABC-type phosphonate transport system ATPase subunit
MPSFKILLEIAARHFAGDQRLHLAQRLEHAEIEIAAIDERPHEFLVAAAVGIAAPTIGRALIQAYRSQSRPCCCR